jgi:hypothetical protein
MDKFEEGEPKEERGTAICLADGERGRVGLGHTRRCEAEA